jgi:hypothetical protein
LVKLLFEIVVPTEDMPSAERMWVQVIEAADGRYVGVLDNEPGALTSIGPGSRIEFGPEHVISLMDTWPMGELKAAVSRRSHMEDLRPRYACRDEPLRPQDSGWQILVGDELTRSSATLPMFCCNRSDLCRTVGQSCDRCSKWARSVASGSGTTGPTHTFASRLKAEPRDPSRDAGFSECLGSQGAFDGIGE